jgi:hypothetical protein
MTTESLLDLMERYLPCPPDPMPEPGSDADYLWQATLVNTKRGAPLHVVQLSEYQPPPTDWGAPVPANATRRIILVECDDRGHGVRVIHPTVGGDA